MLPVDDYSTPRKRLVRLSNGRIIGWLCGKTFTKAVHGSRHQLKQPFAWAIDADTYENEVKPNAQEIVIWDRENDYRYKTSVEHFDMHKGEFDRGWGKQAFLVLSQWEVIKPNGNGPVQLAFSLEGGAVA